jgi:hypothetical protein
MLSIFKTLIINIFTNFKLLIKSSIVFKNPNVKLFSVFIFKALFNKDFETSELFFSNAEYDEALIEAEAVVEKGSYK